MEANASTETATAVDVTEDQYDTARTEQIGWCTRCEDFTTPNVAAQEVTECGCADCSEPGVLGALRALRGGFITIERAVLA